MIDFTKPIQTRAGEPVRILCTDAKHRDGTPVLGLVTSIRDQEHAFYWYADGRVSRAYETDGDLINVPEKKTILVTLFIAMSTIDRSIRSFSAIADDDAKQLRASLSENGWKVLFVEAFTREVTL